MTATYTDNGVPYGSRVEAVKSGVGAGTAIGSYVLENITLQRPSLVVERRDQVGKDNGWALEKGVPNTGSCVVQIATATTQVPAPGMWFSDTFDGSTAGAAEQWVFTEVGQVFESQGYFKANASIRLSRTPPTS